MPRSATRLGLLLAFFLLQPAMAAATARHNWVEFPSGTYTAFTTDLVIRDPQPASTEGVFWAHSFQLSNGKSAYIGIQTRSGNQDPMFIFSVWDATSATPAPGAFCVPFGGEGVGQSCRRWVTWVPGRTYRLTILLSGSNVIGSITDMTTSTTYSLGTIPSAGATSIMRYNHANWTELYLTPPCHSLPRTSALFSMRQAWNGSAWVEPVDKMGVNSAGTACYTEFQLVPEGPSYNGFRINTYFPAAQTLSGDWDGAGGENVGMAWYGSLFRYDQTGMADADVTFFHGSGLDWPVSGDWDGDGDDTAGFWRIDGVASPQFHLRNSSGAGAADHVFTYGQVGDVPIAGNWNIPGSAGTSDKQGFYRRSTGLFRLAPSLTTGPAGSTAITFGDPASYDRPLVGDWDGDGKDEIGTYRLQANGSYLVRLLVQDTAFGHPSRVVQTFDLGQHRNDVPVAGNWNTSDVHDEIGVYRLMGGSPRFNFMLTDGLTGTPFTQQFLFCSLTRTNAGAAAAEGLGPLALGLLGYVAIRRRRRG